MGVIRLLRRIFWLGLIVYALTIAAVIWQARTIYAEHGDGRSVTQPVDVAIVLGAGVDPDMLLGYSTRRRVRLGVKLLQEGKTASLILSGGPVQGDDTRAAHLMRDFALSLGAPADAILVADRSRTTFENLRFSKRILTEQGLTRVALVTDEQHLARSAQLAALLGVEIAHIAASKGISSERIILREASIAREAAAWWYNLYKAAGWWALGELGWTESERGAVII